MQNYKLTLNLIVKNADESIGRIQKEVFYDFL